MTALDATPTDTDTDVEQRIEAALGSLTLERKAHLLTGRDFWTTWPIEEIGLRSMLVSDGPSGVRGESWDERSPSLNLPSATSLSSTWDVAMAGRYGHASAVEARRKGVDVVLGPTINLHRSPLGGRHFEAFSEDPLLTAELGAAYVTGVQANGVGATPKHYVANDFESERFTADVQVSERALRELYLFAFEKSVVEARAWLVMSAYNSINGVTATENDLLETPLNSEWEFDGVVISDWTAVRSLESARAAQDLVMPGPAGPWGDALVEAVRSGAIDEAVVDRKVLRMLRLAARVGALDGIDGVTAPEWAAGEDIAFTRTAAAAGTVLLRNENDELPWSPQTLSRVAVIGHNATVARTQGGGSATVVPESIVSPLDGVRDALPNAQVDYAVGAIAQEGIAEFPLRTMRNPATGDQGARVRFLDSAGAEIFTEDRFASSLVWFGGDAPVAATHTFELHTIYTPERSGRVTIGFASVGHGTVHLDGELVFEDDVRPIGSDLGAAFLSPPSAGPLVDVMAGVPVDVRVAVSRMSGADNAVSGAMSLTVGFEEDGGDPAALRESAVALASKADVAIVVVGTNSKVESEGYDRTSLALPGEQDALVAAVAAANPRTVVIVNSGSPVLLPWRNEVSAIAVPYFAGQEFGNALADVLFGAVEPGGRLPTTWPVTQDDVPVLDVTPHDGVVAYDEGIHIGYRAWLRAGRAPAYPFGFGLGYTTWALEQFTVDKVEIAPGDDVIATLIVTNTGTRAGKHVVQLYASRSDTAIDRPVRWLVGFATVESEAGESSTVSVRVSSRALAHWDSGWQHEPGAFTLHAGSSVVDLPLTATVRIVD